MRFSAESKYVWRGNYYKERQQVFLPGKTGKSYLHSTPRITLEAWKRAQAWSPSVKARYAALLLVIMALMVFSPERRTVISVFTAPGTICTTDPLRMLHALNRAL